MKNIRAGTLIVALLASAAVVATAQPKTSRHATTSAKVFAEPG